MAFDLIRSEKVYQGRAFGVRRDQVRLPNGQLAYLDVIEHVGSVALIPVDDRGTIWFVRQYRHSVGQMVLELPAGTLEAGEPPEEGAHREVREEIGMAAGQLLKIGEFFLAPGYSTEFMHIYLAMDLQQAPLPRDEDEFLSVEAIPFEEAFRMVEQHKIQDAKTLAALFLARPFLATKYARPPDRPFSS
jgi:ADP-ribose pyrophosphatase